MGLARRFLGPTAVGLFAFSNFAVLWSARSTLGYDYQAYVAAAERILSGRPLYDTGVEVAGGFLVYQYPPPFAVAMIPFALLPEPLALWLWVGASVGMVVAAIALLPVRVEVRWVVLLLAALDWPVLYAIKLGQVGPILLLLFAVGWRWLERPAVVGGVAGIGTLIKLQPALVLGWAALSGRWRTVGVGLAVILGATLVTLPLVGADAWFDLVRYLGRVSSPVTTPHNFTPGAVAYQGGLSEEAATIVQYAAMAVALGLGAFASLRRSPEVGFLTTVVASQILSPLLWDHYAMLLLLPTALLLERGHRWAIVIPLLTPVILVGLIPGAVYPLAFAIALLAPTITERARS